MKKNLEAQYKELEEKRKQFEEEKVAWEAEQRLLEQQKLDASKLVVIVLEGVHGEICVGETLSVNGHCIAMGRPALGCGLRK